MNDLVKLAKILENATSSADVDKSRTLAGWHSRACAVRGALEIFRAERDSAIESAAEKYKGDYLNDHINAANADFNTAVKIARDRIETDLQDVLDSKRRAWNKSNNAPGEDAIRMLQALEMRGPDLTDGEIMAVVEKLNNNAVALRSLRSICKRAGVSLPSFIGTDPDDFEQNMEQAREYAEDAIRSLETDTNDLTYKQRLFWEKPGAGLDAVYFTPLDRTTLTSEMIERNTEPDEPAQEKEAEQQ